MTAEDAQSWGIIDKIVDLYKNYKDNGRSKLFNYFVKHKLKNLMEHIQEF